MPLFNEMGLEDNLLQAIEEMGFEEPTDIQKKAIPYLLENTKDLIGLAQTGTGKTAAFGLPIINQLNDDKNPQVLVLCPTRELCLQISKDFEDFTKYLKNINIASVYGGTDIRQQIKDLKKHPEIVIGTPGRVLDLINREKLNLSNIRWAVLDEADEMLSMGFKEELDAILSKTPDEKQTLLFSATMPKEIQNISRKYMNKPEEISVGHKNQGAENVEHHYYMVRSKNRYAALKRLVDYNPWIYSIIFCRTRKDTREVADQLMQEGYMAEALNGDLTQAQRDRVMNLFREKKLQLLVATDVAARGLDVNDLTHVINYNVPEDPEIYIHRSGRTGRAGKKGISLSLITAQEKGQLKAVEKKLGKNITYQKVPSGDAICEQQLFHFLNKVQEEPVNEQRLASFRDQVHEKLQEFSKEELIEKFVSGALNQIIGSYNNAPDLNAKDRQRNSTRQSSSRRQNGKNGYSRLFLNVGKQDELTKKDLIGLVNNTFPKQKVDIGDIKVLDKISFFEVDKRYENSILKNFSKKQFNGRSINVELAKEK